MSTSVYTEKRHFTIPNLANPDDVTLYLETLKGLDNRGIVTLRKHLSLYAHTFHILQGHKRCIEASIRYLNGERATNKANAVQKAATKFLNSLNTPQLRQQCVVWKVDYDTFDTQEDVIAALIEKQVA